MLLKVKGYGHTGKTGHQFTKHHATLLTIKETDSIPCPRMFPSPESAIQIVRVA